MPGFGFGTWQSAAGDITVSAVKAAVKAGYRNIDTAAKGYVTTIPSVIKLAVSLIHDETLYARESVSITKDMNRN